MRRITGLPLMVIGATLILAPVIAHGISSERDKDRVAEFYREKPNSATLPSALQPSNFAGYDWACFGIGVAIAFSGLRDAKQSGSMKPDSRDHAEI